MRRELLFAAAILTLTGCPSGKNGDHATMHVVTQLGEPAAGALFFVHEADGTLVRTGETGDDGDARVSIDGGEMLTAFYAFTTDIGLDQVTAYTIADVQPGDELWFPVESFDITGEDRGDVAFTFSGVPFAGASSYGYALAGCPETISSNASSAGTFVHSVPAGCLGDAFEPWAFARNFDGQAIAFELLPSGPLTGFFANGITFAGAWRTDFAAIDYDFTNIPAGSYSFEVSETLYDADERRLFGGGAAALLVGLTTTSGTFDTVPFATLAFGVERSAANSTNGTVSLVRAGAPVDVTLDYATLPGFLTSATIGTSADARLQISWEGGPAVADFVELKANYGVAENRIVEWKFRLPPETLAPFVFPEWPPEYDGDRPPNGLVDLGRVRFVDGEWADWDAAREDDPRDDLPTSERTIVERLLD